MSEVDSGYEVSGIRSLGDGIVRIILTNSITDDGFAIDMLDYMSIADEDFDDMLIDAVDSRLDELQIVQDIEEALELESEAQQARKGWKAKKTAE